MSNMQQQELFAKLLDGSLTQTEWAEVQSIWGDAKVQSMLSGEQRLRDAYQRMSESEALQDLTSLIMKRVVDVPAPNRGLLWVLKYGGLLGSAIFVVGLTIVVIAFSDSGPMSFSLSAPELDTTLALWGLPVMVLFGIGIWRMETA